MEKREKLDELESVRNKIYIARLRLRCIEASVEKVEPYSGAFESLTQKALQVKEELKQLWADEFRLKFEVEKLSRREN